MRIIHIDPRAPLHVGQFVGIEREALHLQPSLIPSDTLFAALVVAWARQGAAVAERIEACAQRRALLASSVFPRVGDVRLYPAPLGVRWVGLAAVPEKERKRVAWVSEHLFQRLTRGQDVSGEWQPGNLAQGGSAWLTAAEMAAARVVTQRNGDHDDGMPRLWRESVVPRVSIDRASNVSNLFHSGRVTFSPGCGLWCMLQGDGIGWAHEALLQLQDDGLGGLRSTGHGSFTFSATDAPDVPEATAGYAIALSRYAPAHAAEVRDAVRVERTAFNLVTVGGWCHDDGGKAWRRRSVRMLAEGACVGASARGHIVDVKPDAMPDARGVVRYGLAFALPVRDEALVRE